MKYLIKAYLDFEFQDKDPEAHDFAKDEDEAIQLAASIIQESNPDDFEWDIEKIPNPDLLTGIREGWWF